MDALSEVLPSIIIIKKQDILFKEAHKPSWKLVEK